MNDRFSYDSSSIKIGDIVYREWGYSMTIVDFYRIVDKVGKCTFYLEKLPAKVDSSNGGWSGTKTPDFDAPITRDPFPVRYSSKSKCLKFDHTALWIWDGKPKFFDECD